MTDSLSPTRKSSLWTLPLPGRSSSAQRRRSVSPSVKSRYSATYPAGDGASRNQHSARTLPYVPPSFPGTRTIFTNNWNDVARRASASTSAEDSDLFPDLSVNPKADLTMTPIRKVSRAVIDGIGNFLTSDTLSQTASAVFSSAARLGSTIVSKGIEVANHLLQELELDDVRTTEDELTCRGFGVKVQGVEVSLESIRLTKNGLLAQIRLDPKLSPYVPVPPFCDAETNVTLTFDRGNRILVATPPGTSLSDINWDTSENGILTLYLK